jgi:ABC-type nitrate/sulfonate/bicarbonate transport system substrate-binding protein
MTARRRLLTGGVAALCAALLAACAGGQAQVEGSDGTPRPVTLMLNWTPNNHHAGIYAAAQNGWYEEAGLDVRIVEPSEAGADQVVGTGQAEFGLSQAESLLPARAAGVPVVSIATVLPTNDSTLMALADEGVTRPRDLAGTTYGGFGGALETELVTRLVACDGGDPAAVEFVEVGNVDYLGGLRQDRYDFVWVFNGWDALRAREVEGVDIATIPFAEHLDCIPDWYTPILLTSESLVADDPELVRAFLDATARGYRLADEDPEEAARLLLEAVPELDRELVEASAAYHAGRYAAGGRRWGVQDAEVWREFAGFLAEAGLTEEPVPTDGAFTNDLLPQG